MEEFKKFDLKNWQKKFPIEVGTRGRDEYYMYCADGERIPWSEYDAIGKIVKKLFGL